MGRSKKTDYIVRVLGTYEEHATNSPAKANEIAERILQERPSAKVQVCRVIKMHELSFESILSALMPEGTVLDAVLKSGLLTGSLLFITPDGEPKHYSIAECFTNEKAQKLLDNKRTRIYLSSFRGVETLSTIGSYGTAFVPGPLANDSYFFLGQIVEYSSVSPSELNYLVRPLAKMPRLWLGYGGIEQVITDDKPTLVKASHFSEWSEHYFRERASRRTVK